MNNKYINQSKVLTTTITLTLERYDFNVLKDNIKN
jgi:hypothetical protein